MDADWSPYTPIGVSAAYYHSLDSTNDTARALTAVTDGGAWVVAGAQLAGRGRQGRQWKSDSGNLYASYRVAVAVPAAMQGFVPLAVGLAVCDAAVQLGLPTGGVRAKWPNDVLFGGQKFAGILIEALSRDGGSLDLVIGVGINLAHHPAEAQFPATHIGAHLPHSPSVQDGFSALASALHQTLRHYSTLGFNHVSGDWLARAWGIGERVHIRVDGALEWATPVGLEADGALRIQLDGGGESVLYAGDIVAADGSSANLEL